MAQPTTSPSASWRHREALGAGDRTTRHKGEGRGATTKRINVARPGALPLETCQRTTRHAKNREERLGSPSVLAPSTRDASERKEITTLSIPPLGPLGPSGRDHQAFGEEAREATDRH